MTDQLALAAEFDSPTQDQWLRALRPVILKSNPDADEAEFAAAFDRQLVHRTEDGIEIQPLYTAGGRVDPPACPASRRWCVPRTPRRFRGRSVSGCGSVGMTPCRANSRLGRPACCGGTGRC